MKKRKHKNTVEQFEAKAHKAIKADKHIFGNRKGTKHWLLEPWVLEPWLKNGVLHYKVMHGGWSWYFKNGVATFEACDNPLVHTNPLDLTLTLIAKE